MKKRLFSLFLALILVVFLLPATTTSAAVYGNYIVEANSWDDLIGYLVSVSSPIEIKITKDINVTVDASDWGAVTKDYSFRALVPIRAHKAINLNGHTINVHFNNGHKTESPIRAIFDISDGAMLTVYGGGSILGSGDFSKYFTAYEQKYWPGATVFTVGNNGDLIVNGGTINGANKDNNVVGAVSVRGGGSLTVNGGILSCVNTMGKRSLYEGRKYYAKTAAITVDIDEDMPDITINGGTIHSPDATSIMTPWIAQWEFYGLLARDDRFFDYNRYTSEFAGGWKYITINGGYFQSAVAFRVPTEEDLNRVGNGSDWLENNYPADAVQCVVPLYKKVDMVIPSADLKTCIPIAQAPEMSVSINGAEAAPNTGETIRLQYVPGGKVKVANTYSTKLPSFIKDLGGTVTAHSAIWINGSKINVPAITPEVLSSVQSRQTYTRAMTVDEVIKMEIWYMIRIPGFGSIESQRDTYEIYVAPTLITSASVTMPDAVVGQKANLDTSKIITEGAGYRVSDIKWYRYNPNPSLDEDYYELMSSSDTFEAGEEYEFKIQLAAKDGYKFNAQSKDIAVNINGQTITESNPMQYTGYAVNLSGRIAPLNPAFTMQPTVTEWGVYHTGSIIKYNRVTWETNFEPVKIVVIYNAGTAQRPNPMEVEVTDPYVDIPQTSKYQYRLRAYYSDTKYVLSDWFSEVGDGHTCTLQQRLAKVATCTEPGWKFYYQCNICKRYYADKDGKTLIKSLADWKAGDGKVEATGHKYSEATCTAPATCSKCGITEGSKLPHKYSDATCTKAATCTDCGATTGTTADHSWIKATCTAPMTCSVCGATQGEPDGHKWNGPVCEVCKAANPNYGETTVKGVTRVFGDDRYQTAFKAADTLKAELGVSKFQNVIVASGTGFADALAGSYLSSVKNAPILLVRSANVNAVKDYIKKNLASGGTVYLLGGENAVPKTMETGLDGFTVKRLGGATRYDTNLLILKEAGVGNKDIIVCTGLNFADSLSASATGLPILLVKSGLTDAQKAFLASTSGKKIIVGGTAAVNATVEKQLKTYGEVKRLAGDTRYDTSVLVAKEFFSAPKSAVLAYAQNFPDGLSGGPVAYALKAPLILTDNKKPTAAVKYATSIGIKSGYVLGGTGLISDKVVKDVFSMAAADTIIVK